VRLGTEADWEFVGKRFCSVCRMGRNYMKGYAGDRANAVLPAAGYNFSLLLRRFEQLLRTLLAALTHIFEMPRLAQS
jgi:hypothetical protein